MPTLFSTMNSRSPSPPGNQMRKRCASPSGSCGDKVEITAIRGSIYRTGGEHSNGAHKKREKTMEPKIVERRTVLKGGAAAVGMLGSGASASMVAGVKQASADTPGSSVPDQ